MVRETPLSLRLRLLLLVLLAVLPTLFFTLYILRSQRERALSGLTTTALQLAMAVSVQEERWIADTRTLLNLVAEIPEVQHADPDACAAFLSRVSASLQPSYVNIGMVDAKGQLLCSARAMGETDLSGYRCVSGTLERRAFTVGDYHFGTFGGSEPALAFGLPLLNSDGTVRAVVFAALSLKWLQRMELKQVAAQLSHGATLTEVDHQGVILVAQPEGDHQVGEAVLSLPLVQHVLQGQTGITETFGLDGKRGYYAYTPVHGVAGSPDLYVIVGYPDAVMRAPIDATLRSSLAGVIAVTALSLMIALGSSQVLVTQPISHLLHVARQLGDGVLTARAHLSGAPPEVMRLADALNSTAEALQAREEKQNEAEMRLRDTAEQLRILHTIDSAILATRSSAEEIVSMTLLQIQPLIPWSEAYVLAFDAQLDRATVLAALGTEALDRVRIGAQFPLQLYGELGEERQLQAPLLIPDLDQASELTPMARFLATYDLHAYLGVPLVARGETIGELVLASVRTDAFDENDKLIAQDLASSLALAIDNGRLLEEARDNARRLGSLSARLIDAQEAERRRLARELHDEIGQALTLIKINLLTAIQSSADIAASDKIAQSLALAEQALEQVRGLSLDLRPSLLDDLGLVPALSWYLKRQAQHSGLTIHLAPDTAVPRLSPDLETACFRVVQEALTNVVRHAQATRIYVGIGCTADELRLTVRDNGTGFDVAAAESAAGNGKSMGLASMAERVQLVDGELEIESALGYGTEIRAIFPVRDCQTQLSEVR